VDPGTDPALAAWLEALERRHLADRTLPEVRRALQALSAWYVERRGPGGALRRDAPLGTAGKRAAYALFYGPLHYLVVRRIVAELGAGAPAPRTIVDLGCGTGAAGAAWALATGSARPRLTGVDESAWAVDEARLAWRTFGLAASMRRGSVVTQRLPGAGVGILAAYTINELQPDERDRLLERVVDAGRRGARILIVEPIARGLTPWWEGWVARFGAIAGRSDDWRFRCELPEPVRALDRAAGLDHGELTARSLYAPGSVRS
jgi:hypothetical protein